MQEVWFQQIDDYLGGRMNPEAQREFEAALANEKELPAIMQVYREVEEDMREKAKNSNSYSALHNTLNNLGADYKNRVRQQNETTPRLAPDAMHLTAPIAIAPGAKLIRMKTWKTLAAAAAVIGMVSVSAIWFFTGKKHDPQVAVNNNRDTAKTKLPADTAVIIESVSIPNIAKENTRDIPTGKNSLNRLTVKRQQLFAAYFTPDALPANLPEALTEPLENYKAARHKMALEGLDDAYHDISTRGIDEEDSLAALYIHYYKAQSYLATNHASKAIAELKNAITQGPNQQYRTRIDWYLALAYLKNGDVNKAKYLLQALAGNSQAGAYKLKAVKLLGEIPQ